jgi:hypothetical protein
VQYRVSDFRELLSGHGLTQIRGSQSRLCDIETLIMDISQDEAQREHALSVRIAESSLLVATVPPR